MRPRVAALVPLLALALAGPVWGQGVSPGSAPLKPGVMPAQGRRDLEARSVRERAAELEQERALEAEKRAYWQKRYRQVLLRERQARRRVAAAEQTYSTMKKRERIRGEERAQVVAERSQARKAWDQAREAVEAFPEEARRAEVPPGWLREVEEALADAGDDLPLPGPAAPDTDGTPAPSP